MGLRLPLVSWRGYLLLPLLVLVLIGTFSVNGQLNVVPDVKDLSHQAKLASERGDLNRAAALYEQIVKLEPRLAEARSNLGMIYFSQRKFDAARQSFESALRLKPTLVQPGIFLGITEAELGRCEQATRLLETSFGKPLSPDLHRQVGLHLVGCLADLKETPKTLEILGRLTREFPSDPDVLYIAAKVYSGLSTDALFALREVAPDSYQFHQMMGEIFEMRGEYTRAEAQFRIVLIKNPDAPGVHYRLGIVILQASHDAAARERAKKEFGAELAHNPTSALAEYQLASLARQANHLDEAERRFSRALEFDPRFVGAYIGLGKIQIASGSLSDAIMNLEKARDLDPKSEAAHYWLANALRRAGRNAEAKRETLAFQTLHNLSEKQKEAALNEPFLKPAQTAPEEEDHPPKP